MACKSCKEKDMPDYKDEDFILAMYMSPRTGAHMVYGARPQGGRPYNYGRRKSGDVFDVLRTDVIAMSTIFVRPTDRRPFNIAGGRIVDASPTPTQLARQTIGRIGQPAPPPPPRVTGGFVPQQAQEAGAEHGPEKLAEALLGISGVGQKTVSALMKAGATIASVSQMQPEELEAMGITSRAAAAIYEHFN